MSCFACTAVIYCHFLEEDTGVSLLYFVQLFFCEFQCKVVSVSDMAAFDTLLYLQDEHYKLNQRTYLC